MFTPVELIEQEPQPALLVHARIAANDLPALLGQAYGKIMGYLGPQAETLALMPYVAYYNLDMQNLEIDAGFTLRQAAAGSGEIQSGQVEGGRLVSCMHFGPYADCGPAYEAMNAWIAEQGYQPTGLVYEFYLNDPQVVTPDQIQMQILMPLKDRQS